MFKKSKKTAKKTVKYRDTDYLALSARVRALEGRLLTRERRERMLDAKEDGEVARILTECGYPEPRALTPAALEECLGDAQAALIRDLESAMPKEQTHLFPVFQIKYDYHNAKALIKAEAMETDAGRLLVSGGRFDPRTLADRYRKGELGEYPAPFRTAVTQARELLAGSKDPQRVDLLLDRACFGEMADEAAQSGCPFVERYVARLADGLNLRAYVRAKRNGQGPALLEEALIPCGSVDADTLAHAGEEHLVRLFRDAGLARAAELGVELLRGNGTMTAFERACDDALLDFVAGARRVPFGVEPILGYLYARQEELTAIRTICSGRSAGLDREVIRERLREAYG